MLRTPVTLLITALSFSTNAYEFGEYEWNDDNDKIVEFAATNKDFILEHGPLIYERYQGYKWFIEAKAREHHVPPELAYIAAIESSLDSNAVSKAGAVGMWQFMKPTAVDMGLTVSSRVDERKDWKKSTDAAFKYLKWLAEEQFGGDYHLAVLAYNYGVGNTKRIIRKVGSTNPFQLIEHKGVPQESREYLLKFLTYLHLYDYLKTYGVNIDEENDTSNYTCVQLSNSLKSCTR